MRVVRLNVYRLLLFPIFGCCFDVFFCVARVLLAKNKCNTYIHTCDACSDLVYINVCSDLVFSDMRSILLPTMRSNIFGSLSLLIVVADGRVLVFCYNLCHRCASWRTDVVLIVCGSL